MNSSLSYYVLVDGTARGPFRADAVASATPETDPLVCVVGHQQWVRASSVAELAAWLPPPLPAPPPSGPRAQANVGLATADYLFFDPAQPKVVGLLVVYGLVVSPLMFLIGTCGSLAEASNMGEIAESDVFVVVFWSVTLYLLIVTVALAVSAMALRNRWRSRWQWAFSAYTVRVVSTVLVFLSILASNIDPPANVPDQPPTAVTTTGLLLPALGAFSWCFEVFAVVWLLINRRRFTCV